MSSNTDPSNGSAAPQAEAPNPSMAPSRAWTPGEQPVSPRKRRRSLRLGILATLLAAYAAGTWFFSTHFTPGTTVDGVDAGLMTTGELSAAITKRVATYEQHVTSADGFDATIRGTDIGLAGDGDRVAAEALARTTPLLWLPSLVTPQHMLIDAGLTLDEELLAQVVGDAVKAFNDTAEPPTNATASYVEKDKAFAIVDEAVGTALDAERVGEEVMVACRSLRGDIELDKAALLQPTVVAGDERLVKAVEQANATLGKDLALTRGDETVATVTPEMKAPWLSLDDELALSVNVEGIREWVRGNDALVKAGSTTDDEHVWELDSLATADAAHHAIRDASDSCEIALTVVETKPPVTPGAKERGRHLDVNLTTQFVRFYDADGTVIWDSYCVTGGWDPDKQAMHATPTGTFAIEHKETDRMLIGADTDHDNKPDYESFVSYWMPFLNNDYGFHDATWRSEFGGDIRSWWGSHGCINLPFEKAEQLYGMINPGDEVVVHY